MVLRHGKTVEYGSVQQIIEAPREDYTQPARLDPQDATRPRRADQSAALLRVEHVDASYGKLQILDDVTPARAARARRSPWSANPAPGKSTLARVVTGLLPPSRGIGDLRRKAARARPEGPQPRGAARAADDLPDGRRGDESAPDHPPDHRPPAHLLFRHPRRGEDAPRRGAARPDRDQARLDRPLSGRAFRRAEAARLHRPRARREAKAHHLRRADLGARPAGGGRHPEASDEAAGGDAASPTSSSPTTSRRSAPSPIRSR